MKYGHEYKELLASEGFPAAWVSSAISYRELKKCIKKIQQELVALGLDADTLQHLPSVFGVSTPDEQEQPKCAFVPELWIAVDKQSGNLIDAGLTDGTRKHFSSHNVRTDDDIIKDEPATEGESFDDSFGLGSAPLSQQLLKRPSLEAEIHWTRVPLTTAANFFNLLDPKLAELDRIQHEESHRLEDSIVSLGATIGDLTEPQTAKGGKIRPKVDVDVWREILALYIESTVFFSSYEQDHGSRTFCKAKAQMQQFSDKLVKQGLVKKFHSRKSTVAFDQFVTINLDILKAMRFQEINMEATRKILKKFDKRTALGAGKSYQGLLLSGPFAKSIAKDMCAAMTSEIVTVVPQMDDYICPICYGLAWRPIRLQCCNNVYCIRCVIQLQRDGNEKCPMCRSSTIMLATPAHIDQATAAYLMKYFPREVKERQKANERAAGIDLYGPQFYRRTCSMM
ncbi:hypothetical protein MBLNU459_g4238t1 [Dothideomycetes sp. NU459]